MPGLKRTSCAVAGCAKPSKRSSDLCVTHHRYRVDGVPVALMRPLRRYRKRGSAPPLCSVPGCGTAVKYSTRGLCHRHYRRLFTGLPMDAPYRCQDRRATKGGRTPDARVRKETEVIKALRERGWPAKRILAAAQQAGWTTRDGNPMTLTTIFKRWAR